MSKSAYDKETIYCRKLGHMVPFSYCDSEHNGLPCTNIRNCWFERLPVDTYLKEQYNKQDIAYIFARKKSKIATILDLVKQTKNHQNS